MTEQSPMEVDVQADFRIPQLRALLAEWGTPPGRTLKQFLAEVAAIVGPESEDCTHPWHRGGKEHCPVHVPPSRPAPEPTDQTREQIMGTALDAAADVLGYQPPETYIKVIDAVLRAVHVSPETAVERTFTAAEVVEIAKETSDSLGNLYRLDFIDRIQHEADSVRAPRQVDDALSEWASAMGKYLDEHPDHGLTPLDVVGNAQARAAAIARTPGRSAFEIEESASFDLDAEWERIAQAIEAKCVPNAQGEDERLINDGLNLAAAIARAGGR